MYVYRRVHVEGINNVKLFQKEKFMHENRQNRSRDSSLLRSFRWEPMLLLVVVDAVHRRRSSFERPLVGLEALPCARRCHELRIHRILWVTTPVLRVTVDSCPGTVLEEPMARLISRARAAERLLVSQQYPTWMRRVRVHCPMPLSESSIAGIVALSHRWSTARRRCSIAERLG